MTNNDIGKRSQIVRYRNDPPELKITYKVMTSDETYIWIGDGTKIIRALRNELVPA